MATFLLTAPAESGHVFPMLSVAQALSQRGHRVLAHVSPKFEKAARQSGAEPVLHQRYKDFLALVTDGDVQGPGWLPGFARSVVKVRRAMLQSARVLEEELEGLLRREKVDCLVADFFSLGARYAAERVGCRFATVAASGTAALGTRNVPVAPPQPQADRVPARVVNAAVELLLPFRRVRAELGLPKRQDPLAEFFSLMASDALHLVTAFPGFLPNEPLRPGHVLVGPMSFSPPRAEAAPFEVAPGTVLVSTTTTAREDGLLSRVLRAMDPLGVPVLATAAGAKELPAGLGPQIRIEPFIPHDEVLPKVVALVTHGGWGTSGRALRHGVPMLVLSMFGDQPAVGRRLAALGLARHLPAAQATPEVIRAEVKALLADEAMARRAKEISRQLAGMDSPVLSAEHLERLVGMP